LSLLLNEHYYRKAYRGVDAQIHIVFNSALVAGKCAISLPAALPSEKGPPGTHWIIGWVDPIASMNDMEK
jgi:hypothetical protein